MESLTAKVNPRLPSASSHLPTRYNVDGILVTIEALEKHFVDLSNWFRSFQDTKARDVIGFELAMELCGCYDIIIHRLGNCLRGTFGQYKFINHAQDMEHADQALSFLQDILRAHLDQRLITALDNLFQFLNSDLTPEYNVLWSTVKNWTQESAPLSSAMDIQQCLKARWLTVSEMSALVTVVIDKVGQMFSSHADFIKQQTEFTLVRQKDAVLNQQYNETASTLRKLQNDYLELVQHMSKMKLLHERELENSQTLNETSMRKITGTLEETVRAHDTLRVDMAQVETVHENEKKKWSETFNRIMGMVKERDSKIDTMLIANRDLKSKLFELESCVQEYKANNGTLNQQMERLQLLHEKDLKTCQMQIIDIRRLNGTVAEMESAQVLHKEKLQNLQTLLKKKEAEHAQALCKLNKLIENLEKTNEELKNKLCEHKTINQDYDREKTFWHDKYLKADKITIKLKEQLQQAETSLREKEVKIQSMLSETTQSTCTLDKHIKTLEESKNELINRINVQEESNKGLKIKVCELETMNQEQDREKTFWHNKCLEADRTIAQLLQQTGHMELCKKNMLTELTQLKASIEASTIAEAESREYIQSLESSIQVLEQHSSELNDDLKALQCDRVNTTTELVKYNSLCGSLKDFFGIYNCDNMDSLLDMLKYQMDTTVKRIEGLLRQTCVRRLTYDRSLSKKGTVNTCWDKGVFRDFENRMCTVIETLSVHTHTEQVDTVELSCAPTRKRRASSCNSDPAELQTCISSYNTNEYDTNSLDTAKEIQSAHMSVQMIDVDDRTCLETASLSQHVEHKVASQTQHHSTADNSNRTTVGQFQDYVAQNLSLIGDCERTENVYSTTVTHLKMYSIKSTSKSVNKLFKNK